MKTQDSAEKSRDATGPVPFMARNSVSGNIILFLLIVGGIMSLPTIKQEVFPEFSLDTITVQVPYPGASPAEVEQGVILAVEEAVRGVDGIKKMTAFAQEGSGTVVAELENDASMSKVNDEIQSAVDRITSFPKDAERPVVSQAWNRREVLSLIVSADLDEWTLRDLAEGIRDDLLNDPHITIVELNGVRPYEISVEIPQETLRRFDLTLSGVAQAIREASVELPGGGVKTQNGEILLRTDERRDTGADLRSVVLKNNAEGSELTLGEIATIRDGFQDVDRFAFYDGKPAIALRVYRVGSQTPIEVSDAVNEFIREQEALLPPGIELTTWRDMSNVYRERVDLLLRNAATGLCLVILILGAFLDLRLAFWITLGIPISFFGALIFFPQIGVSLNMISLFGFILTLGVVVDDAIVVGESVYKKREDGMGPMDAAIQGTLEVAGPVTFSVLTTVIAFLPLLIVPGVMGKIMRVLPLVVISILALSLFESLFILPAHLAHTNLEPPSGLLGLVYRIQHIFARALDGWIQRVYAPSLAVMMRLRYVTMACSLFVLILTGGLVAGKRIVTIFMPRIESDLVSANAVLPFGSHVDETREVAERLRVAAEKTLAEFGDRDSICNGTFSLVGSSMVGGMAVGGGTKTGGHLAEVQVFLVSEGGRDFGAKAFAKRWRENFGSTAGIDTLKFKSTNGPSGGADIDIQIIHKDTAILEQAGQEIGRALSAYAGVEDIDDGFEEGKVQLDLQLTREGRAWGFSELDLGQAVRGAFYGHEALRQQRGRHEVRTYVRLPEEERRSEEDIEDFLLLTPTGAEIPLSAAARVERGRAYKEIQRRDGRRVLHVTAEVDEDVTNATRVMDEVAARFLPQVMQRYPGLQWQFSGAQESRKESLEAMFRGFVIALVAMFSLMAVAFGSYTQPLLIMLTVPFGIVGAIWGHLLMGMQLSLMSMFGVVALAGVVVNDSLVLISAMNKFLAEGMTPLEAVQAGAIRRFRPILLTSLTTFLGLMPMLTETSMQARFLIPMAVSLGIGVMFATFITLVIVPAAYLILNDVTGLLSQLYTFVFVAHEEAEGEARE